MTTSIEKWDLYEMSLNAAESGNPFLDVDFAADFSYGEDSVRVQGFYDGEGVFKIRFMPDRTGAWRFVTHSNLPTLDGRRGEFECTPAAIDNHGPVRVADACHFAYADGTPYHPVGTTAYVWNHQRDELVDSTLKTLVHAPFNKMRMCVFPKRYIFNTNEPPCYPFPGRVTKAWDPALLNDYRSQQPPDFWDFSRFNPVYFRRLEQRIADLRDLGIEADLILFHPYDFGAWGFDRMPPEVNDRYLQYVVARVSAFRNVWWSFANEYDLMFDRTMDDWDHYFQYVQAADPYQHLRSIHNCVNFYDHTRSWVTHCSVQNHNLNMVPVWLKKYGKPVVVDECGYEGDITMQWGDLSPEELVERFWLGFAAGGYVGHGETYLNDRDELWWSKGGELHGESIARIAFLRQVIEQVPPPGLFPLKDVNLGPVVPLAESLVNKTDRDEKPILPDGPDSVEAAGHCGSDCYLFYFGTHQPRFRNFNLPEGSFRIDLIDTWNMTIETVDECAVGLTRVDMPRRRYQAVRVQRN